MMRERVSRGKELQTAVLNIYAFDTGSVASDVAETDAIYVERQRHARCLSAMSAPTTRDTLTCSHDARRVIRYAHVAKDHARC